MSTHTIDLPLGQATREQLYAAYDHARKAAFACEQNGVFLHTWSARAEAIDAELTRRRIEQARTEEGAA